MKACHEIRFSNGGHMFACSLGSGQINIFNFYTGENPQNMQCKGHVNRVRSIDWLENDTGFISCANDGNGYCWDMIKLKEDGVRSADFDFNQKGVQFSCLCNVPEKKFEFIIVGSDRKIYHVGESRSHVETDHMISTVNILHNGKAFFAGVGEKNCPGSI